MKDTEPAVLLAKDYFMSHKNIANNRRKIRVKDHVLLSILDVKKRDIINKMLPKNSRLIFDFIGNSNASIIFENYKFIVKGGCVVTVINRKIK